MNRLTTWFQSTAAGRWYGQKESSEQQIILVVALLVLASVLWLGVCKPLLDWREMADNRYTNARSNLSWLQANEQRARASADVVPSNDSPGSSIALVTRTGEALGLSLSRVQPSSSGGVNVVLDSQRFDAVLEWLVQLRENNDVIVTNVSINREEQPGLVDATLDLR